MDAPQTNLLIKLPREIRDIIYRYLLSTTYTFVEDTPDTRIFVTNAEKSCETSPRQRYVFHPAILRVNKQIGGEAAEILYDKNSLIVIKINACINWYMLEISLPQFVGLASYRITEPVLAVSIMGQPIPNDRMEDDRGATLVTGPECLGSLIECLWHLVYVTEDRLDLTLAVNPRNTKPHRGLLEPFQQVQRLGSFTITGTDDQSLLGPLRKAMSSNPPPESVQALIEHLSLSGIEAYRQKRYHLAQLFGARLGKYEKYLHEYIIPRPNSLAPSDDPFHHAYNATYAQRIRLGWRSALACLHLEDYKAAKQMLSQVLYERNLCHRGTWTHHQDEVLRARFRICDAMIRFGLNDRKGKWDLLGAVKMLKADGRYAETAQSLLDDHDAARDEFREKEWAKPAEAAELGKKFFARACRSYFDFLEPEEHVESEELIGADFEDAVIIATPAW